MRCWIKVFVFLSLTAVLPAQPKGPFPRAFQKGEGRGKQFKQFGPGLNPQLERLRQMPPEQREQVLSRLPPGRRAVAEQRLNRLESLTPEQRTDLANRLREFQSLAVERRQALRAEIQNLRRMNPQARTSRLNSDEERQKFSAREIELLREVSGQAAAQASR